MQTILVANPKGGSGKTTLATNIAGWLAGKRQRVVLEDRDPQQSSAFWLARRPALFPPILAASHATPRKDLKADGVQWRVIDSAAGLHGDDLREAVRSADVMLVPLSPSMFDMAATARFLQQVAEYKAVKQGGLALGLVGMRVDRAHARSRRARRVHALDGVPVVAHLRDTQVYVYCARDGASDLRPAALARRAGLGAMAAR